MCNLFEYHTTDCWLRDEHTDYAEISFWQIIINNFYFKYEIRLRSAYHFHSSRILLHLRTSPSSSISLPLHDLLYFSKLLTSINFLSYIAFVSNISNEPKTNSFIFRVWKLSFNECTAHPGWRWVIHNRSEIGSYQIRAFEWNTYPKLNRLRNRENHFFRLHFLIISFK